MRSPQPDLSPQKDLLRSHLGEHANLKSVSFSDRFLCSLVVAARHGKKQQDSSVVERALKLDSQQLSKKQIKSVVTSIRNLRKAEASGGSLEMVKVSTNQGGGLVPVERLKLNIHGSHTPADTASAYIEAFRSQGVSAEALKLLERLEPFESAAIDRELSVDWSLAELKGAHPNLGHLVAEAKKHTITDTKPESLKHLSPVEQIQALVKDYYYDELAKVIRLLWGRIQEWLDENAPALLGELRECAIDDAFKAKYESRTGKKLPNVPGLRASILRPLADESRRQIVEAPTLRAAINLVKSHISTIWAGHVTEWENSTDEKKEFALDIPDVAGLSLMRPLQTGRMVLRGTATAIKVICNLPVVLYERYTEQYGCEPSGELWGQMFEKNISFIFLWANANIALHKEIEQAIDEEYEDSYWESLVDQGLLEPINLEEEKPDEHTQEWDTFQYKEATYRKLPIFNFMSPARLRLIDSPEDGIPTIDLADGLGIDLTGDELLEALTRGCPAIDAQIIRDLYTWIGAILTDFECTQFISGEN